MADDPTDDPVVTPVQYAVESHGQASYIRLRREGGCTTYEVEHDLNLDVFPGDRSTTLVAATEQAVEMNRRKALIEAKRDEIAALRSEPFQAREAVTA